MLTNCGKKFTNCLLVLALILSPILGNKLSAGVPAVKTSSGVGLRLLSNLFASTINSDFDQDSLTDKAELSWHNSIQVNFGNARTLYLSPQNSQATRGKLISGDIDHDNDLDLVWISDSSFVAPVIWLGNGAGNFSEAEDASIYNLATINQGSSPDNLGQSSSKDADDQITDTQSEDLTEWLQHQSLPIAARDVDNRFSFSRQIGISHCLEHLSKRGPPSFKS